MNSLGVNQKKLLETKKLLMDIIKEPYIYKDDDYLKLALRSQGGLAKYNDERRSISACSLNTLKNVANILLNRGFTELDELRLNAKHELDKAIIGSKVNTKTLVGLNNKIKLLEKHLSEMKKANFLLSTIIEEMRIELKKAAYSNYNVEQAKVMYIDYNKRLEEKLAFTLKGRQ